jgi:hypothetical protein
MHFFQVKRNSVAKVVAQWLRAFLAFVKPWVQTPAQRNKDTKKGRKEGRKKGKKEANRKLR